MIGFDFDYILEKTSNYGKIAEILHMIEIKNHAACFFLFLWNFNMLSLKRNNIFIFYQIL